MIIPSLNVNITESLPSCQSVKARHRTVSIKTSILIFLTFENVSQLFHIVSFLLLSNYNVIECVGLV